jgi:hypothetical protein
MFNTLDLLAYLKQIIIPFAVAIAIGYPMMIALRVACDGLLMRFFFAVNLIVLSAMATYFVTDIDIWYFDVWTRESISFSSLLAFISIWMVFAGIAMIAVLVISMIDIRYPLSRIPTKQSRVTTPSRPLNPHESHASRRQPCTHIRR